MSWHIGNQEISRLSGAPESPRGVFMKGIAVILELIVGAAGIVAFWKIADTAMELHHKNSQEFSLGKPLGPSWRPPEEEK